jgi:hypothetical protein
MAICRFWPLGKDVTVRELNHGFLSLFNTYLLSNTRHFNVILVFLVVDFSEVSISTGMGRPRPEMTSPVARDTIVSYSSSSNIFRVSCTVSTA